MFCVSVPEDDASDRTGRWSFEVDGRGRGWQGRPRHSRQQLVRHVERSGRHFADDFRRKDLEQTRHKAAERVSLPFTHTRFLQIVF